MTTLGPDSFAVGRYLLCDVIGGGGMAQVHLGRLTGAAGFSRVVAIKRLHPHLANDPHLVTMLVDEARLASRIRHPNVVPVLDVVRIQRELLVVMEYVHGVALSQAIRLAGASSRAIPLPIALRVIVDVLGGLGAAHAAKSERGRPLEIVHRDVSPQNVLVGSDGITRVLDFGIAKAHGKMAVTREGELRGKLAYMAPEQLARGIVDRRTDLYAAGVVLWELVTGRRLFTREIGDLAAALREATTTPAPRASTHAALPPALDDAIARALAVDAERRFATAEEMITAVESGGVSLATAKEVAAFFDDLGHAELERKRILVERAERLEGDHVVQTTDDEGAIRTATVHIPVVEPTRAAPSVAAPSADAPTELMTSPPVHAPSPPTRVRRSTFAFGIVVAVVAIVLVGVAAVLGLGGAGRRRRRRDRD
jgi:eukaryotic-like serine/threonine-protein kinase